MMTPAERETLLMRFAETRERVLRNLRGLSPEQMLYRPEPSQWSVAEIVEHLVVVENHLVGEIEKLVQRQPDFSKQSAMADADVFTQAGTTVRRIEAPAGAVPTFRWPPEELLREFETTRQRTCDFAAATDADLRRHFMPHVSLGQLDGYQWLLLVAAHCQRHCAQSERVKASPGFPQ
jgi:uncharacterized damage-inducible protein DinB